MIPENVLILDIESETVGSSPDSNNDIHKITGIYSYKDNKYHFLISKDKIQEYINSHKVIVGHNIKDFDKPILERLGINFDYKIIAIIF